jgi:hypothetical protein
MHYPTGICGGRGKRGALVEKGRDPWQRNDVTIYFLMKCSLGKKDEDKRRQENSQT